MRLRVKTGNESNEVPDEEIIRQAQHGNAAAFEQLYRRYSARVYFLCLRMLKNVSEAEDVTQDAFLQLFRKIHTFRGDSQFSTWLHRMTFNLVLMRFRKRKYTEASLDEAMDSGEDEAVPAVETGGADLRLSGVIDRVNLLRAIAQLPPGYKKTFLLHDVEGYEHHEIADILGCTVGNSKSQVYKARQRLRKLLQEVLRSRAREARKSTRGLPLSERHNAGLQFAKM